MKYIRHKKVIGILLIAVVVIAGVVLWHGLSGNSQPKNAIDCLGRKDVSACVHQLPASSVIPFSPLDLLVLSNGKMSGNAYTGSLQNNSQSVVTAVKIRTKFYENQKNIHCDDPNPADIQDITISTIILPQQSIDINTTVPTHFDTSQPFIWCATIIKASMYN